MKNIEERIAFLVKEYGYVKVNLKDPDGGSEGVWAVPISQEFSDKCGNDSSIGEAVTVRLCNEPLCFGFWGCRVLCKTSGEHRPTAVIEDQPEEYKHADWETDDNT